MTTSTLEHSTPKRPSSPPPRRLGRRATVIVVICSLLASGALREWAVSRQEKVNNIRGTVAGRSTLGNMDSFTLALMLGGLRGPLVMFLWPAIENQKADHNLEDVDTMIEWVRLLQPEFDSVHMFQIWNKAYNISAMLASAVEKYKVIMDALEYGAKVDRERPGDINILRAIQDVYGGKLGFTTLPEFPFYSKQFREDSMTEKNRGLKYPEDNEQDKDGKPRSRARLAPGEPLLTDEGRIRPDLLAPSHPPPADLPAGAEWNDGSELQYLAAYQPFPYGIGPLAMSYNYAKRAEVAQSVEGQISVQSTPMVIDSQPGLALRFWEEDEARRARGYEEVAFFPLARVKAGEDIESKTIGRAEEDMMRIIPSKRPVNEEALSAAIYHYGSAKRLAGDAINEYKRHISKPDYKWRSATYGSHIAEMEAAIEVDAADEAYLRSFDLALDTVVRSHLLKDASQHYEQAQLDYERIVLEFYTEGGALPEALREKPAVLALSNAQLRGTPNEPGEFDKAMNKAAAEFPKGEHSSDRAGYLARIKRCKMRIDAIFLAEIFQIANGANPSTSSDAEKYRAIMDALDYAAAVEAERPGDVNVLRGLFNLYFVKLCNPTPAESSFLSTQFLEDTMTLANRDLRYPQDKGRPRLTRHDPLLTADDHIRPDLLKGTRPLMTMKPARFEYNDGAELQYLKPFEPYPFGIAPIAMAYNYAKRAQVGFSDPQRAVQNADSVVDANPGHALSYWEQDSANRAGTYEARAFGIIEPKDAESARMQIKPTAKPIDNDALQAAIYYFETAAKICPEAIKEYQRHVKQFDKEWPLYRRDIAELQAAIDLYTADRDYLKAFASSPADRAGLLESAAKHYKEALSAFQRILGGEVATGGTPSDVAARSKLLTRIARCKSRIDALQAAAPPATRPAETR